MHRSSRLFPARALLLAASGAGAASPPPAQRVDSPLGVSFDLPAGWVEVPSDIPWVQRFQPASCPPDASPPECPTFIVLQRLQPVPDRDASALSRRRAQGMQPAWRGSDEGVHAGGGAWRAGRYTLGWIDSVQVVTNLVDGDTGWELTGWSPPEQAQAMAAQYMASGASLRVRAVP